MFVLACIIRRYYNESGIFWFILSLSLLLVSYIICADESTFLFGLFCFSIYLIVFNFLINNHLRPTVTASTQICTNLPDPPLVLADERVYCSPIIEDDTFNFATITHDSVIQRRDRCIYCGRTFDAHYLEQISLERRISIVNEQRNPVDLSR